MGGLRCPKCLATGRAELRSSSRRYLYPQCESGSTQVPRVESTKTTHVYISYFAFTDYSTRTRQSNEVTATVHTTHSNARAKQAIAVPVSGWRELYQLGGRSAAYGCPLFYVSCLTPCIARYGTTLFIISLWARCTTDPPPVHHTLRSRVSKARALIRFGVLSPPPPCITRYGSGFRISRVFFHFSLMFMRAILSSRLFTIIARFAGTSASSMRMMGFCDLVCLLAEKL